MNIREEYLKTLWYEDESGKLLAYDPEKAEIPPEAVYQVSCFPLVLQKNRVRLHSDNCSRKEKSGEEEIVTDTTYLGHKAEKIITAMVNSKDYTLSEAILLYIKSCERCCNVLAHTYTNGELGYKEYSIEWRNSRSSCIFCKNEE